jgi:hypothetical protein
MLQTKIFFLLLLLTSLIACSSETVDSEEFQSTAVDGVITNADLIRSPVSADGLTDTINVAKMIFTELDYNFGTVMSGDIVEKEFSFVNTGKVPLLISDARSTCGCTVPEWPKEMIQPGESGVISVVFDTKNKSGRQAKPVTITANTYPVATRLRLIGEVSEK